MDFVSVERVSEYMQLEPERPNTHESGEVPQTPPPRPPRLARQGSDTTKGRVTIRHLRFRWVNHAACRPLPFAVRG